jgi:predicted transcriptional regulator
MPRITATFTISLPPEMAKEIELACRNEHRTRSELVREALRSYLREAEIGILRLRMARLPEDEPTADELAAIRTGEADFRAGRFRPLKPSHRGIQRLSRQSRGKKA